MSWSIDSMNDIQPDIPALDMACLVQKLSNTWAFNTGVTLVVWIMSPDCLSKSSQLAKLELGIQTMQDEWATQHLQRMLSDWRSSFLPICWKACESQARLPHWLRAHARVHTCASMCQDAETAPAACPVVELPSAHVVSLQGRRANLFMLGPPRSANNPSCYKEPNLLLTTENLWCYSEAKNGLDMLDIWRPSLDCLGA